MKTTVAISLHLLLALFTVSLVAAQGLRPRVTTNTTEEEHRLPLIQIPEFIDLLQSAFQILTDELGKVSVPENVTGRSQVIQVALHNTNIMRIAKRIASEDDIRHIFLKPEAVSQRCYDDVVDFVDGLIGQRSDANSTDYNTTTWAFIMLDAFGKPASGYLPGTFHWVGNYAECSGVHAIIEAGTYLGSRPTPREMSSEFYPRYCRVQLEVPSALAGIDSNRVHGYWEVRARKASLLHWGMCLPESCGEHEVEALVGQALQFTPLSMTVHDAVCFERDRDLGSDAGAIVAICLLSVIGAVTVVCTLMESAIFFGYLSWYTDGYNTNEVPTSSGKSSWSPSQDTFIDPQRTTDTYQDVHQDMEQDVKHPSSANQSTPLSRDGRPKDVLEAEQPSTTHLKSNRQTLGLKLLQAFSLRYNGSKLCDTSSESNSGMLESIQGIRVLSILWVILGHTYSIGAALDSHLIMYNVVNRISQMGDRLTFTFVAAVDMGVDSFFLICGLLVMMNTIRELRNSPPKRFTFWIIFSIRRIWRYAPLYMMVLMVGTTLYDHIVDGPLKADPYTMFEHCESRWWANLINMNNMIKPLEMCMPWTWYLAVDFQLYTMMPLFIMLYNKKYRYGIIAQVIVICVATIVTFITTINNPGQMLTMYKEDTDYFKEVFIKPYSRMAGFFIGVLTAVVLEDFSDKIRLSKLKCLLIWVVLGGIVIFLIMIPHDQWKDEGDLWPKGTLALYECLKRPLWSLFVAWIIFSCQTGRGGILADFLKWRGFQRLARLTFSVYLVHPMIITFFMYERNLPLDLEDGVMIYQFFGNVIMSYLFAVLFTLLFEAPAVALTKILFGKK